MKVDSSKIDEYVAFATRLAEIAGREILPHFRARIEVENKGGVFGYDPVTVADRAAETAIRAEIARVYPGHGIIGEEHGTIAGKDGFTWVIDPIDGTRAFIIGQLHWGTLIALSDSSGPIVGVMRQPYTDETFVGAPGLAELRRGDAHTVLRTRKCERIEDAVVCATDPRMFIDPAERRSFRRVSTAARLTRFGGDCYSYCMVAAGFVDLVIESMLQPYDIQPLVPIIESAGGIVTTWSGEAPYQGGRIIAAGDPTVHRLAMKLLADEAA